MTMKENHNAAFLDSKSIGKETVALSFGSKETHELNYSIMDGSPITFEAKDRDETPNYKLMDEVSMDNENGSKDPPTEEGQNGVSHRPSDWKKDAGSLSSDSCYIDKEQRSSEHEGSATVEDFANCNRSDLIDSSSPYFVTSDLTEPDVNLFTDKNVLECELPELEICYQEIACQILKDIIVDEGRPHKDINVIVSCKDEKLGNLFPQPPIDFNNFEATEDSSVVNQYGSKEENGKKLVYQRMLESLNNPFEKDTAKHYDHEDSILTGEAYCGATGKAETNSSEEDCLVDRELPVEDFGEGKNVMHVPDQILTGEAVSDSPASSSAEAGGTEKEVRAGSLLYNSKVESGNITFNFNSPVPVVDGNDFTKNVEEQCADSGDVLKDVKAETLSDSGEVPCISSIIENVQEQTLMIKDGNSDGDSATSNVQCARSEDSSGANANEQYTEHKDANSHHPSKDSPVQFPANESRSSTNDAQAVERSVHTHERKNSANDSVVSQLQHDEGETSFSAASLITYSGPIPYSGSLSHRSDASTTSGKSFAFPILQSEWSSSPVRMAKADKRHFRKHKCWRSGLLCCRF